jgi:NADH:ubiquinone oxidoreductase subunit D
MARCASGLGQDLRKAPPCAAYERFEFNVQVETEGNVQARLIVRAQEND